MLKDLMNSVGFNQYTYKTQDDSEIDIRFRCLELSMSKELKPNAIPSVEEILNTAEQFFEWVMQTPSE